jgi:hypothetical protein
MPNIICVFGMPIVDCPLRYSRTFIYCIKYTSSLYLALPCSKTVLESGKNMVRRIFDIPIELNMANIVFITNVNEYPFEIIEFVMLFTKYYIHCCKWSNNLPTIEVLKAKLKSREKNGEIKFNL